MILSVIDIKFFSLKETYVLFKSPANFPLLFLFPPLLSLLPFFFPPQKSKSTYTPIIESQVGVNINNVKTY